MVTQSTRPVLTAGLAALGQVRSPAGFTTTALYALQNGKVTYSASGGAMTVSVKTLADTDPSPLNPVWCAIGLKDPTPLAITYPLSVVIPSGATVGAFVGTPYRLYVVIFEPDPSGFCSLGVLSCVQWAQPSYLRIHPLTGVGRVSSTAIGTGSDSAGVFYTTSALSDYQYRIIGFADFNSPPSGGTWGNPDSWVLHGYGVPLPGQTVQTVQTAPLSASATDDIPFDSSIPQDTEGTAIYSNTIVPVFAPNIIRNDVFIQGSNNNASSLVNAAAVFRSDDSSTDAIGVIWGVQSDVDLPMTMTGFFLHPALSTSSRTFSLRLGGATNGATDFTLGGIDSVSKYGSALKSHFITSEIMG